MEAYTKMFVVAVEDTAKEVGSGDLDVLATPVLLAMVEYTAKEHVQEALAPEETSVGSQIAVKHLQPSRVGASIVVKLFVDSQEKTKINFSFQVLDGERLVATGTHQRAVILTEPFLKKLDL